MAGQKKHQVAVIGSGNWYNLEFNNIDTCTAGSGIGFQGRLCMSNYQTGKNTYIEREKYSSFNTAV